VRIRTVIPGGLMDELIQQLKTRVGLDEQKARSAANTVVDYLKQKLPAPVVNQVESAVSGTESKMQEMKEKISGTFGKKTA
jgi:hypothetical protein